MPRKKISKREMKEELKDINLETDLHTLKWINFTRKVYGRYLGNRINELKFEMWEKYSDRLTDNVLEYDENIINLSSHIDEYKKYIRSEISLIKTSFENKNFYNNPNDDIMKGIHLIVEHAEENLNLEQNFGLKSSMISNLREIEKKGNLNTEYKLRHNELKELVKTERQLYNFLKAYVTKDI